MRRGEGSKLGSIRETKAEPPLISGFVTIKVARWHGCAGARDHWMGAGLGSRTLELQMFILFENGLWPVSLLTGQRWAILGREKRHSVCKAASSLQVVKPLAGASQVILTPSSAPKRSCLCLRLLSNPSSEGFAMLLYQMSVLSSRPKNLEEQARF